MPHAFPNVGKCCGMLWGGTSRSVNMGLRPTHSDENHVGRASTPAAGLQTRLFPNRLRWVFDRARVAEVRSENLAGALGGGAQFAPYLWRTQDNRTEGSGQCNTSSVAM